jgi:lipopolysaccharide export LptBFGC system permease protein LptF
MGELIDLQAVEKWFGILAMLAPIAGIAIGAALQFRSRRSGALVTGTLIGLLGPANWLLWHIYNRIEDHYGLDSVKAMLINLALFAALGIAVGMGFRFLWRSARPTNRPENLNT